MGLSEKMERLEAVRKRAEIGISVGVLGVLVFLIPIFWPKMIFGFLGIGMIAFGVIYAKGTKEAYQKLYKELFAEEPLRANFENVFYAWRTGFDEPTVKSFQLCEMGNRFKSEDYLRATYKGINFEMSDVTVQYHSSNGKSSSTVTYFRGRMFAFDCPANLYSSTRIYSRRFHYRGRNNTQKDQKVEMESVRFNEEFDIYSNNPHDVFYLLTPQYMEYMETMLRKYPELSIHFNGNKLLIGINEPEKDVFDKKDWLNETVYPDEMEKIQRDIDDIKSVIEMFFITE
ncbi:Protein of unknown function [Lachnospiraceae bacterium NE2001]|nr:Protein of unknown function [Lachnospiraceae bacterium NE2001]